MLDRCIPWGGGAMRPHRKLLSAALFLCYMGFPVMALSGVRLSSAFITMGPNRQGTSRR